MYSYQPNRLLRIIIVFAIIIPIIPSTPALAVHLIVDCGPNRVANLIAAIEDANSTLEEDIIELAPDCVYMLTETYNPEASFSDNGLPVIVTPITIIGNRATIRRSTAEHIPSFRLFNVKETATLTIGNITLSHGEASAGGGIYNTGEVTVTQSMITHNASNGGGGIFSTGTLFVEQSTFTNNTASGYGGAINAEGTLLIEQSTFTNNTASGYGGAINAEGILSVNQSSFNNNVSVLPGGAIFNSHGPLTVTKSSFNANQAFKGGGIAIQHDPGVQTLISDASFTDNIADEYGGGIHTLSESNIFVQRSTFSANTAIVGGGIANEQGSLFIERSTFNTNNAWFDGGAVANADALIITQSTISANVADRNGGGVYNAPYAHGIIVQSTLSMNTAHEGGGIFLTRVPITVSHTIIANNTAVTGTDIFIYDINKVGAGNYNLIGSNETIESYFPVGLPNADNNYVGSSDVPLDPQLGPLADNGGSSLTHLPLAGSPAINAGPTVSRFTTDQRGFARIYDNNVDLGAVEAHALRLLSLSNPTVTEGNSAIFTVTLNTPSSFTVTTDYSTSNGSAQAHEDYTPLSGTLTLAPGSTQATLLISTTDDLLHESNETFSLTLSKMINATIVPVTSHATIVDNDTPVPSTTIVYVPLVRTAAAGRAQIPERSSTMRPFYGSAIVGVEHVYNAYR